MDAGDEMGEWVAQVQITKAIRLGMVLVVMIIAGTIGACEMQEQYLLHVQMMTAIERGWDTKGIKCLEVGYGSSPGRELFMECLRAR